jgi:hypothetical protein
MKSFIIQLQINLVKSGEDTIKTDYIYGIAIYLLILLKSIN